MSNTSIQLKKSGQTGNAPSSLAYGEVAINYADGKLYYKDSSNVIRYITNQDTFSTINVDGSLLLSTSTTDTLTLISGNNIVLTPDVLNDKITVSTNNTINVQDANVTNTITTNTLAFYDGSKLTSANDIVVAASYANSAFGTANSAGSYANGAFAQANAAYNYANSLITSSVANGTSNIAIITANGNIIATVAGNNVVTISSNGLTTTSGGGSGDISGANNIYANSFIATISANIAGINVVPYIQSAYNQANTDVTNVSVTAGQYGSATVVPVITIAANGRITSVSNATISGGGGGGASGSYISNGTSNVYFSGADGNILANVAGNTIVTITANGIITGADRDISGANTIYANNIITTGTGGTITGANNIYSNNFIAANGIVVSSLNVVPYLQSAFATANAAFIVANTPSHVANSAAAYANGAFTAANSAGSYANSAFSVANTDVTNVSVTAGQYGNTTTVPVLTIAANGRITAISNATISGGGGGGASGSYISNGTSNVYFTGANGNIVANVAGNTIVTITANSITASDTGVDISGANTVYANNIITTGTGGTITGANNIYSNNFIAANGIVVAGVNVVTHLQSAFTAANTPSHVANSAAIYANGAFVQANAAYNQANTDFTNISITSDTYGNSTYIPVITVSANGRINSISTIAATGGGGTTDQYARDTANSAGSYANSAFIKANNALANTTGTFNGDLSVTGIFKSLNSTGDEGGQIDLAKPTTNTTITTGVSIDVYQNKLRIFETGGTNRGVYIDITNASTGVATDLLNPSATPDTVARDAANSAGSYANSAFVKANAAYNQANSAFDAANSAGSYANSAYNQANTATTNASTADSKAVSAGSYANSAFGVANSAAIYANGAFIQANAAFNRANTPTFIANGTSNVYFASANGSIVANVAGNTILTISSSGLLTLGSSSNDINGANYVNANSFIAVTSVIAGGINVVPYIQSAFTAANTPSDVANSAASYANGAFAQANAVFNQSNTYVWPAANSAGSYANSAFAVANTDVTNISITSGTYGNASYIPIITVSANGRINTISTIASAGGGGGAGTDQVARDTANAAFIQANAAYAQANTGGGGGSSGSAIIAVNTFTANGAAGFTGNSFSLTNSTTANNIVLNVDGVLQLKSAYSVSGNTLILTSTPANNAIIEATIFTGTNLAYNNRTYTGDNTTVTFTTTSGMSNVSLIVTENGIVQEPGVDYYISGANVVFTTAPSTGVKIGIRELASTANVTADLSPAFNQANAAFAQANAAFNQANTASGGVTTGKAIAMAIVFGG